jgi:MFS family permease
VPESPAVPNASNAASAKRAGSAQSPLDRGVQRAFWRLAPYLMALYIVSFLDRANVGFAKQALAASVGISEGTYALGAGLFFLTYSTCGFPSNLILHRIGAKIWISFLLVGWGLASMATMFVTGSASFYALRLLLGVLEAGFFPGTILYLTYWFPNRIRGEIQGFFYLGVPLSLVLGGPLSGLLLEIHEMGGLEGWQWMFLVEGFLAVAMGVVSFRFLENKPADARWLPAVEKQALIAELAGEEKARRASGPAQLAEMLRNPRVLRFVLIYFMIQMSIYAQSFICPRRSPRCCASRRDLKWAQRARFPGSARRLHVTGCRGARTGWGIIAPRRRGCCSRADAQAWRFPRRDRAWGWWRFPSRRQAL